MILFIFKQQLSIEIIPTNFQILHYGTFELSLLFIFTSFSKMKMMTNERDFRCFIFTSKPIILFRNYLQHRYETEGNEKERKEKGGTERTHGENTLVSIQEEKARRSP